MTINNVSVDINSVYVDNSDNIIIDEDLSDILDNILIPNSKLDHEKLMSEMNKYIDSFEDSNYNDIISKVKLPVEAPERSDYNLCPLCHTSCKISGTMIVCENCGTERAWDSHSNDLYSISIEQNYNTMNNSFMTFSIVGMNSYCYNRSFLKTCADYSAYRNHTNKKDIVNRIYQYEGNKPPHNIINATVELFEHIKNKGYVYRGDGKLGVIGACLYYTSIQHNLMRTHKEISAIMGIDEKFIGQGDRILQELNEMGLIDIPTNNKPLLGYLATYLPKLGIPEKYKQFIIDTLSRAERKHLHINHESRITTKVIGVIYLLTKRVPELHHIKKEAISEACNNISKATFIRYYTLIIDNHVIMKKVFRKHKIPMPLSFKATK